jgi:hypothetical protein
LDLSSKDHWPEPVMASVERAPQHLIDESQSETKMSIINSSGQQGRERHSKPRRVGTSIVGRVGQAAFGIFLLTGSSSWAGYTVDSHMETAAGTNYYTWTVYNQDQVWGLDGFTIEVPLETHVLAHTVPAPYANPDSTAYWIMEERYQGQVDSHDGEVNIPAPRPGMKLLVWWGEQSPSVYPPGTTVTFSVATDASVGPGIVRGSAATYTPQNNPHYYVTWQGQLVGPGLGITGAAIAKLAGDKPKTMSTAVQTVLVTNLDSSAMSSEASMITPLPRAAITLHAGITVGGLVGSPYGIQYSIDLADPNGWHGLGNVILTTPNQVWYDPQPASNPQRYYRIVPGPISIP